MPGHKVSMTSLHWQTSIQTSESDAHCTLGKTGCVDFLDSELGDDLLLHRDLALRMVYFDKITFTLFS